MTEHVNIETDAAPAGPQLAPLDQIDIAPENLRADGPADAEIPELADTIAAAGLLYPLLVRPGRKGEAPFMALDGRRRLLALRFLAENGRAEPGRPVWIEIARTKPEQAAAIVISNTQRAPVHVADVIVAVGKLRSMKMTPAKISGALGYPEIEVKRLQRLAGLPKAALEALRTGRISLRTAKLLARVTDADVLRQFAQNAASGYLYEHSITQHLNGRPGLDDPRFDLIGVERYRAAGGRIDADLFGEFDDVVLDPDKLQVLWTERAAPLVEAAKARGLTVYFQGGELYRAPDGLEAAGPNAAAALGDDARRAWDLACGRTDDLARALSEGERHPQARDADLVAFLIARLEQEAALHGAERIRAVGLYPKAGTGFEVQVYMPLQVKPAVEADADDGVDPDDAEAFDPPTVASYRPEIQVPAHAIDTKGRSHALHETYTDIATRGLIRSVADDPRAALTITVARMFTILALQGGVSTDLSASTLQGRRYSRGALPADPALDGVVRDRLEARRRAYLEAGLRPLPWVDGLPHGEKMALLAELIAVSLDLRESGVHAVRRAARVEAAEIAELTGHDISTFWRPDVAFLAQHSKAQLMGALAVMEADVTPTKGLKKDDLVGYVASVAAEKGWAPAALNLRLETTVIADGEGVTGSTPGAPDTSSDGDLETSFAEPKAFAGAA